MVWQKTMSECEQCKLIGLQRTGQKKTLKGKFVSKELRNTRLPGFLSKAIIDQERIFFGYGISIKFPSLQ